MTLTLRFRPERIAAVVAGVFGVLTLAAGGSVLVGRDPGYVVYRPLLQFNVAMGLVYLWGAYAAWRGSALAPRLAAAITIANAAVLAWIATVRQEYGGVAGDSLGAMIFRTGVWAALWWVLAAMARRKRSA